jgi:hypothetical protein
MQLYKRNKNIQPKSINVIETSLQLDLASHHNRKAYYIDQNELLQGMINRYVNKIDFVPLNN